MILFGGSFNPPHRAHFDIAHSALRAFAPARMDLIPSGQPWQKPLVAPAHHRLTMLELAEAEDRWHWQSTSDYPIAINRIEIERDTPSYTIDTVRMLRQNAPQTRFIWLIGSDQLANFHTWRDWRQILDYVHVAVAQRAGYELHFEQLLDTTLRDYYREHHCSAEDSIWRTQRTGYFIKFPAPALAVSSTQIRQAIAQHLPTPQLAQSVEKYIFLHNLYK